MRPRSVPPPRSFTFALTTFTALLSIRAEILAAPVSPKFPETTELQPRPAPTTLKEFLPIAEATKALRSAYSTEDGKLRTLVLPRPTTATENHTDASESSPLPTRTYDCIPNSEEREPVTLTRLATTTATATITEGFGSEYRSSVLLRISSLLYEGAGTKTRSTGTAVKTLTPWPSTTGVRVVGLDGVEVGVVYNVGSAG